jgi:hypothetical protein
MFRLAGTAQNRLNGAAEHGAPRDRGDGPASPRAPRFAPRPIEAARPEPVRRDQAVHRANTRGKLARPGRIIH